MPFGAYDRENRLIRVYKRHGVNHVILLVTDEEIETKARKDLREIYAANSMSFTQFPFRDFHAPSLTKATPQQIIRLLDRRKCHLDGNSYIYVGIGTTF